MNFRDAFKLALLELDGSTQESERKIRNALIQQPSCPWQNEIPAGKERQTIEDFKDLVTYYRHNPSELQLTKTARLQRERISKN